MAWSIIREASSVDEAKLKKSARRFCDRHGIFYANAEDCETRIWGHVEDMYQDRPYAATRLAYLWRKCVQRALGSRSAEGIERGYIGYYAD